MLKSKVLWSSLLMAGALSMSACNSATEEQSASATADDAASAKKTLRIATEGAYPPFNYTNPDGSLSGFDVEVAQALCDQMQAKCEIVAQDWDGIIPGLLAKKYDAVVAGMSITPERLEKVDFTEPYFANTMVWLAKGDSGFDPANVSDKNLGGQRSTTPGTYLQENYEGQNGNHVNLYDSYDNAYLDLASGRNDAVLAEKVSAKDWLKNNPDFAIIGDEIDNNDNIAIAVRKGDGLKAEFDQALTAIRENGELAKLEQANFGQ
ncbi:transporter substrate-binding domain-containing protein [Psychrobacter sp. I-STPA6b]|uniref:transporter substrate-binding domain-containing protein n=1 Tax=Psychrobacter sp. I-STPA6b TaxID=2585718 RepID=UPI001D0C12DB|nr:transporter substrate-binding domain-containing protein [Psychrobacter sp. I-STPA6b]